MAGVKPRRAQESHAHPEITASSAGAGDPTLRIYRSWNGQREDGNAFALVLAGSNITSAAQSFAGSVLDARQGATVAATTATRYAYTEPYMWVTRGFIARVQFGWTASSGTTKAFVGLTTTTTGLEHETWSTTAEYSVGVTATIGSAFEWSSALAAGSGVQTTSGTTCALDTLFDLELSCPPGGPVTGVLTDLEARTSESFEFPTAPDDRLLRLSFKADSSTSHSPKVCRMDIVERL